jgi:hypothetical protein
MFEMCTPNAKYRPFIGDELKTIARLENDGEGWYAKVSRPGRPGDVFPPCETKEQAIQEMRVVYPDAEIRE